MYISDLPIDNNQKYSTKHRFHPLCTTLFRCQFSFQARKSQGERNTELKETSNVEIAGSTNDGNLGSAQKKIPKKKSGAIV